MRAMYVTASIRKPFGFLDSQISQALEQCGVNVRIVSPGPVFDKELKQSWKSFSPDFLLAMLGCRLSPGNLRILSSLPIPKAIWYTDDPYAIDQSVRSCRFFNVVFTNDSRSILVYRKAGCNRVHHLPLAAPYPVYAPRRVSAPYRSQICILGSAFQNRVREVDRIAPPAVRVSDPHCRTGMASPSPIPTIPRPNPKRLGFSPRSGRLLQRSGHRAQHSPVF